MAVAKDIFSTAEAAKYLGVKVTTMKKYLYKTKTLRADTKIGPALAFTQETLDRFRERHNSRPGKRKKADTD